jgi:hypothetical protein
LWQRLTSCKIPGVDLPQLSSYQITVPILAKNDKRLTAIDVNLSSLLLNQKGTNEICFLVQ